MPALFFVDTGNVDATCNVAVISDNNFCIFVNSLEVVVVDNPFSC